MASSPSHHSIWHPVLAEMSKALGSAAAGRLSNYAISKILQLLIDNHNDELNLLLSISQDVKDIKQGDFNTGLIYLTDAAKRGITEDQRMKRIEKAKEHFMKAHGKEIRDKFRVALIQYYIGICTFMLGQMQGQDTEIWYADAGDWIEKAYNNAMDYLAEIINKNVRRNKVEEKIINVTTYGTLMLSGPLNIIYLNILRGSRPEKKFFKQIDPVYLLLNDLQKFKAETPIVPLNFQRRLENFLPQIEYIKNQDPIGNATKGTSFEKKK